MRKLLLAPHHDDETLFAAYICQQHRPHIVTVLRSENQASLGITNDVRAAESFRAAQILGCEYTALYPFPDDESWEPSGFAWDEATGADLMWRAIRDVFVSFDARPAESPEWERPELVWAPWPEPKGHQQHNRVGELALEVFGEERVTFYATYQYGGPRSGGTPVEPTREQVLGKLRALACYESQILRGPVRFFTHPLDEFTRGRVKGA